MTMQESNNEPQESTTSLTDNFKKELDAVSANTILDSSYRKKKLVLWLVRTVILVVLYVIFWEHNWVKWSLVGTVPLSLFNLFMLVAAPYFLKKKTERTEEKIKDAEKAIAKAEAAEDENE